MRQKVVNGLKELEAAEKQAPGCEFVKGCRKFLTDNGFLSEKQIKALIRVRAWAPRQTDDDDELYPEDDFLFEDDFMDPTFDD